MAHLRSMLFNASARVYWLYFDFCCEAWNQRKAERWIERLVENEKLRKK
jgi:hypothetical protein